MIYRVYYNNSQDAQHWSIDEGTTDTEFTVLGVELGHGVVGKTQVQNAPGVQPRAWLEIEGKIAMQRGWAVFFL